MNTWLEVKYVHRMSNKNAGAAIFVNYESDNIYECIFCISVTTSSIRNTFPTGRFSPKNRES